MTKLNVNVDLQEKETIEVDDDVEGADEEGSPEKEVVADDE